MQRIIIPALMLLAGCASQEKSYNGPYGTIGKVPGKISLQVVRQSDSGDDDFRLVRNDSDKPVLIERYAGKNAPPVAYCGQANNRLRICNKAQGELSAPEASLPPKVTIGFSASRLKGERIAIHVKVGSEWLYLWEDTSITPK